MPRCTDIPVLIATTYVQSHPTLSLRTVRYVQFLEKNAPIAFLLAKQELIELIKTGQVMEALSFATKYLAPCFGTMNVRRPMVCLLC